MTTLSNRQYPMLFMFIELHDKRGFMTIDEAQQWDQRPFRSMLIREWIEYVPNEGFRVTKEGLKAWREFGDTDITRRDPTRPLTAYFDPDVWGLRGTPPKKRRAAG